MILARLVDRPALGYGKVGKILVAVVTVAAIVALNVYAPGIGAVLLGTTAPTALGTSIVIAIGSVAITLASGLINAALFKPKSEVANAKVNVRLEQALRWIDGGEALQGGAVAFAEFDTGGNLWWVLVHCDSIITGTPQIYLDSVLVTTDGAGNVTTPDFMYKGVSYFRIVTHTYTETNPIPSAATELAAAFPDKWDTLQHLLVGTTYSVIRGAAIKLEDRYKVYRWRGPLGMGEPNVALLAVWSNMYDPRDPTQVLGDRSTYKPSRNAALVWAWWRTHPYGLKKPESEVNWTRVAEQADICDESIVGIESTQPRYECGIAVQDNVDRGSIQQQILMSCEGQLVFDDDGKTWMRVGYYYAPSVSLSRNRDIITMESIEAQDGESETQGVVVRYVEPNADYTLQASAPWYNPNYYKPGEGNTFLTVDIATIRNHNQAMRVAKAIGMRSQPLQKLAPTVGLRGLRAMQERIVDITYDNEFAGDYEIINPVEVDESGVFCSLGLVPINEHRFDLLSGEEKTRPNSNTAYEPISVPLPTGVVVRYTNGRIEATFDAPRADVRNEFEYIAEPDLASGRWLNMRVDMDELFAYSDALPSSINYLVRWRGVSSGGAVSDWFDPPYELGLSLSAGGALQQAVYNSWIVERANGVEVMSIASDGTLTIIDHTRRYADGFPDVAVTGATVSTGLAADVGRAVAYDDVPRAGGAVTYALYENDVDAHASLANPGRHYMGYFVVPATGSTGGSGGGIPGGGGGSYNPIP